jgi:hypothetical protein
MSSQIYSREYLQSAHQLEKHRQIDFIVSGFIDRLKKNASEGKTEYRITLGTEQEVRHNYLHMGSMIGLNTIMSEIQKKMTGAELIAGLVTRFPGCKIKYDETNIEVENCAETLKKGIVIDWS